MSQLEPASTKSTKLRDHRSDQKKVPVVYFARVTFPEMPNDEPRIKIGESGNHQKRRAQHSASVFGIKPQYDELCVVHGDRNDEQRVLRYFSKYLLDNEKETFRADPELLDYIRWLRDQWYAWVPDCDECQPLEYLQPVDANIWMPAPDRRKPAPTRQLFCLGPFADLGMPPRETTADDFYTNEIIIEAARTAMGGIDLDPSSHAIANRTVKANRFYTKHDDGLSHQWGGNVWLNPPFSKWAEWAAKVASEWKSGRIESMCVLCATRTLTAQYFSQVHRNSSALCIMHGRIPFWGELAGTPDDGHAVFYFGKDTAAFSASFSSLGQVYITQQCGGA